MVSIPRVSATVPVAEWATGAAPVIASAPPSVTHVGAPTAAGVELVKVLQAAKTAYAAATTLGAGGSSSRSGGGSGGGLTRRMEEEVWRAGVVTSGGGRVGANRSTTEPSHNEGEVMQPFIEENTAVENVTQTAIEEVRRPAVEEPTAAEQTAAEEVLSAQALAVEEPTAATSEDVVQMQEVEVCRDPTAAAKAVQTVVAAARTSPASAAVPVRVGSASSSSGGDGGGGDGGSRSSRWLGEGAIEEGGGRVDSNAANLYLLANTCLNAGAAASGEGRGGVSGSGSGSGVGDEHEVCVGDSNARCVCRLQF